MNYFVIKEDRDEGNVYVSDIPEGLVRQYQLLEGVPRSVGWPQVTAKFSDRRPEGMRLTDWLPTPSGWLLVSDRFKKLIEAMEVANVEYLPIRVRNHKKKIVSESYWIVNFLNLIEAVDRNQSVFDVDAADKNKIYTFDRLVLRAEVDAKGPSVFRMKEKPALVLVRGDLAERIGASRLTGLKLVETAKYVTHAKPA
jgi:hypothetical protein